MKGRPDLDRVVRQWVGKAENDLRNADHTLLMGADCPFDTVCFHAQQCVEKYLKAQLASRSIDFPKIHDIGELIELLPQSLRPPVAVLDQEKLTYHATVTRYPGDWEPLVRSDAEEAVAIARQIRESVRKLLPATVLE